MNKVPGVSEGMNSSACDLNLSLTEAFMDKRSPEAYEAITVGM